MWSQKACKYAQNREDHCNHAAFRKMYNQCKEGLIASGNVVRYNEPVHYNQNWEIVNDATLAYGYQVTIKYIHLENVFFLDETSDNMHGKDNGN